MLVLENIDMIFSRGTPDENHALKNISLTVNKGDFITVIGSNGAGKSTLYNIIAGTYTSTSGSLILETGDGRIRNITRDAEYKRAHYIGRIFQNPLLGTAGKMSLESNMMIASYKGYKQIKINLNRQKREYFRERLKELDMGLENRLKDNVELFSGGQRQALTLLMAVLSRPSILLLDEHTAALDPSNAAVVMELTKSFAENYQLTVMMVTHNMQYAISTGNRLIMMDAGEIVFDIGKEEKSHLTIDNLVSRFKAIKNKDLDSDEIRFATSGNG